MEIRGDTYELLSRTQAYLNGRGRRAADLSDVIDELMAASPYLLSVLAPGGCTSA